MNSINRLTKVWLVLAATFIITACGSSDSTEQDSTPNAFTFNAKHDVEIGTLVLSDRVIIQGIDSDVTVSVTGGEYTINNGTYTSENGSISNSQSLQLKLMAASEYSTSTSMSVTVGDVTSTFEVTTAAEPSEPEPPVTPVEPTGNIVDINYNLRHEVGGEYTFDRQKYITIHAELTEHDWFDNDQFSRDAPNEDDNLIVSFLDGYDVYLGRTTGGITWNLNQIEEDPSRPGFASETDATTRANGAKWSFNNLPERKQIAYQLEQRASDMIVGAQQHPFWPEGTLTKGKGWALSQVDSTSEPLGTATGHYMAQYFAKFFDQNGNDNVRDGQAKPVYVEVMNEPLYDLTTVRSGSDRVEPADVFKFHNTVATEIRKLNDDLLIGGYTTAFPDFDKDDFQRWEDRDKSFIDIAGKNMDFYSIHLYDFPAFQNRERYRRGSNMEATMDMLEHYSMLAFGETRPLIVSEYGAQIHTLINKGWNPERNTHSIRATNSMLMSFLERPDMILKTIPFIVVKAEWGRGVAPYGPRLMIQKFERDGEGAGDEWVYSDLVLFYDLWSEVNGTRIDTKANDLDIQTDAYVDDNVAYVILNSLEFDDQDIDLNHFGLSDNTVQSVTIKHLKTEPGEQSVIETTQLNALPDSISLGAEATMVIKIEFTNSVTIDETLEEVKYYADKYKLAINKDTEIAFNINNVTTSTHGESVLRLALGRNHGLSLSPTISVNGTEISVPADFRGYDQKSGVRQSGRDNFYGVIEIPVPHAIIENNNQVSVTFDDDGGYIASAVLQVFNSSVALTR